MSESKRYQVAIIGAGPSGACMANLLNQRGILAIVFERGQFPRFSIGESLLPQCIADLEEAGLFEAVKERGYQYKNGAAFQRGDEYTDFDFSQKFSEGVGFAYQVKRADFDHLLVKQCQSNGIPFLFDHQVNNVKIDESGAHLTVANVTDGTEKQYDVDFVVDASGFGRVLPRLFDLELPSDLPGRFSLFCHVEDRFDTTIDREKILVTVNEKWPDVWYWIIPFSDGTVSLGVVGPQEMLDADKSDKENFEFLLDSQPTLRKRLDYMNWPRTDVRKIVGYSSNVKNLCGDSYALLGNAGEFLDPVFSSGVTIACRSACLAAPLIERQLKGESVDWDKEFSQELKRGVEVFRSFVEHWYSGDLIELFLRQSSNQKIKEMICSVLAGYAWDQENPMVKDSRRRLNTLLEWVKLAD